MPYLFLLAVLTLSVLAYIFKFTVIGRRILATGGNLEAAQLSGIRTNNIVLLCHALSGFLPLAPGCCGYRGWGRPSHPPAVIG
ncbi:MAG: hypothetical protein HC875_15745 [Anaerolineales bacterium]|nr:hypothetical protein [Anaerolineales bacterium]